MFPSAAIVEMLGHAGFDWVLLDGDHGSLSLADVKLMCMAADAARRAAAAVKFGPGAGRGLAAGLTPGMPATSETLPEVLASGYRYIHAHLPRVLGAGAGGLPCRG